MAGGGFGAFLSHAKLVGFIKDIQFPCSKQDLLDEAEDHNAPDKVIETLDKLPDGDYNSLADVTEALAKAAL